MKKGFAVLLIFCFFGCATSMERQYVDSLNMVETVADTSITLHKQGLITNEQFQEVFAAVRRAEISMKIMKAAMDMNDRELFSEKMILFSTELRKAMEEYYNEPTGDSETHRSDDPGDGAGDKAD